MISRHVLQALLGLFLVLGSGPTPAGAQRVEPGGAPPPGSGPKDVAGFVRVIDGDTVEAYIDGNRVGIGLVGIDAPQGNTDCGKEATERLKELVTGGLRLEEDAEEPAFDAKTRRMYRVKTRDGRLVGEELVRAGVANANGRGEDKQAMAAAENEARAAGRGCIQRQGRQADAGLEPAGATFAMMSLDSLARDDGAQALVSAPAAPAAMAIAGAPAAATLPSGFVEDVIASGLTDPTAFAFLPDGRILIAQKDGVVRIHKNGALLATPFIDISGRVNDYWDHGLLGIAADPSFPTNGHVYLLYTYENNAADYSGTKTARLARYTASGDTASTASEAVILGTSVGSSCNNFPKGADCIPSDSPSHSVGTVKFAPDGSLFVITGDGAHFNYVDDNALRAQDLDLLSGKLLRVTPTGAGLSTNPFWTGTASANRSKVWASGLRNPYRFNLRPGTDVPYIGDVGWDTWEEVNVGAKGANLGWPCYEGGARQGGYEPKAVCQSLYNRGTAAVKMPLLPYDHAGSGAAVTGGAFYAGTTYPAQYQGAYFYADYADRWIRSLKVDTSNNLVSGSVADFATGVGGPVAIEVGPDTDLYYLAIGANELRRIRYTSTGTTSCAAGQYLAQYYNTTTLGGTPALTRCEAAPINYDWGTGGPGNGVGTDNFSARWAGRHSFAAGDYTFTATADDGIRVWVDGAILIDKWVDQAPTTYTATRTLAAGEHEVRVEYYEKTGGAVAKLSWQAAASGGTDTTRRVNAGGGAFTDSAGQAWAADAGFSGGASASVTAAIAGTADDALYQSERWGGSFGYAFAVPNGRYAVTLKFAEIYWTARGQRVFNAAIEGQSVLSNFDILAEVGPNTALDKSFAVDVTDGTLNIAFTTVTDAAKVSAIAIAPATTGTNTPPTATIGAPASTLKFKVGDTISFSGSATDPEDGTIPAGGLAWRVVIKHCSGGECHDHQLTTASGAGGSFTAPDHEEDFHLELVLTATDSAGLTGTASVAIQPQTARLTLDTSPSGLQVVYNGTPHTAPYTSSPIVGGKRSISAPSPQGSNTFASWSDGGAQQHDVTVPASATTYTASFTGTGGDPSPPTISAVRATGIISTRATIAWTTNEPSDSQVEYGTTTAYGSSTTPDSAQVTAHSVRLSGLTPKTTYYYRVKSMDAAGNLAVSNQYTFTTK